MALGKNLKIIHWTRLQSSTLSSSHLKRGSIVLVVSFHGVTREFFSSTLRRSVIRVAAVTTQNTVTVETWTWDQQIIPLGFVQVPYELVVIKLWRGSTLFTNPRSSVRPAVIL